MAAKITVAMPLPVFESRSFPWIFLLPILLLAGWIQWTTVKETRVTIPAMADAAHYMSYAYNLREYHVYSRALTWDEASPSPPVADAASPPGYALFLMPFLHGRPDLAFTDRVTAAQAVIGTLTVLLVFLLALSAGGPRLAAGVALLAAVTPHLATISTYVLSESLFTFLLLASVLAFVRARQTGHRAWWVAAGLVFGLCCLVRPTMQAVLPAALLLVLVVPSWRIHLRPVALATVCWALLLVPWLVYKSTVPVTSGQPDSLRATLYHGSFPDFRYEGKPSRYGNPYQDDPHQTEIMESYQSLRKWVGQRMRAQPLQYAEWYLLGKPRYFMSWGIIAGWGDAFIYQVDDSPYFRRPSFRLMHALVYGLHWPLMLLGLAGSIFALVKPRALALRPSSTQAVQVVALTVVVAVVLHMIGAPYPRYGIPFRPLFYVMAGVMVAAMWRRLRDPRTASQ